MDINSSKLTAELTEISSPLLDLNPNPETQSGDEQFLDDVYADIQAYVLVVDVLQDGDFQYVDISLTYEKLTETSLEEIKGKKPEEVFSPVNAANMRQHYINCIHLGISISYRECFYFNECPIWVITTLTPLHDADSRIYRIISISIDITDHQQTEKAQQRKELPPKLEIVNQTATQYYRSFEALVRCITEQTRDNVDESQALQTAIRELAQVLKAESCYIELYSACWTTTTITYEYTTIPPLHQVLTRKTAEFPLLYQSLLQKQPLQSVEVVPGWHPTLTVLTQLAYPIFDAQGLLGNLWVIRTTQEVFDEFEQRLVEQVANECAIILRQSRQRQLIQTQIQDLEKLKDLKDDFLHSLSHELRTPITNINLAVQTLESLFKQEGLLDIEPIPQLLNILQNECRRQSKLINDLLTLTYLEAEVEQLTLIVIDLQTWLPPIVESFRELARCQGQELHLVITDELPLLETDITDLERILTELLNNACKFTPTGETITVWATGSVNTVQISVSNSGVEIAKNELSQIFEPFYKVRHHDSWNYGGTGLGLALVKKLVKHLGASISVESKSNQTTFTVKFLIPETNAMLA